MVASTSGWLLYRRALLDESSIPTGTATRWTPRAFRSAGRTRPTNQTSASLEWSLRTEPHATSDLVDPAACASRPIETSSRPWATTAASATTRRHQGRREPTATPTAPPVGSRNVPPPVSADLWEAKLLVTPCTEHRLASAPASIAIGTLGVLAFAPGSNHDVVGQAAAGGSCTAPEGLHALRTSQAKSLLLRRSRMTPRSRPGRGSTKAGEKWRCGLTPTKSSCVATSRVDWLAMARCAFHYQ